MKKKPTWPEYVFLAFIALSISTALAVIPNQSDNFEDGTTQGWGSGANNPNPPTNITFGGPDGAEDNYLLATATGGAGAGSKLVIINSIQWTGDYVAAGVQSISMYIKNFGNTTISLRIAFRGPGGDFWSVNPEVVAASSDWQPIVFSVQPANLTGGTNVNSTLSGVTQVRILHSVTGGFIGDAVVAQIGLDNVTAASQPVPVELSSFSGSILGKKVKLDWITSTETSNSRFDVQRKYDAVDWQTIGNVKGNGTTTQSKYYSFADDLSNLTSSRIYYRLKQIDLDGSFRLSNEISVDNNLVSSFELEQNYPNPFNPSTTIRFNIPITEKVKIEVFNTVGNKVATLLNGLKEAGKHEVQFEAENLASGVYFYKISAGSFIQTKKMLLIR